MKKHAVQIHNSPHEREQSPFMSFGGSVRIKQVLDLPVKRLEQKHE